MSNNFSEFVRQLYEHNHIENILHNLQIRLNINTNILLFCCWFAHQGCRNLNKKDLQIIMNVITPWHNQIVAALRKMYQDAKKIDRPNWQENITSKILAMEYSAHKMEQIMLTETIGRPPLARNSNQKIADACKSISAYCKELQVGIDQQDAENIKQLLMHIFPDSNYDSLTTYWGNSSAAKKQNAFSYLQQRQFDEM